MNGATSAAFAELHEGHAAARDELLDLVNSRHLANEVRVEDLRETSGPFLTALKKAADADSGQEEGPEVHIVLQGPAGVGKTHLAESLRQILSGEVGVQIRRKDGVDGQGSLVVWIVRDGIRPEGAPPTAPVVRVRGLSSREKRGLLTRRLVPRIAQAHGIDARPFFTEDVLGCLLRGGVQEAGLNGAIRRLERLCRRRAREISEGRAHEIDGSWLRGVLGAEAAPIDAPSRDLPAGAVHAPMVSSLGGAMARVEAFAAPGHGRLLVTGAGPQAEIACKVARTRLLALAPHLSMPNDALRELDWHIHVAGPTGPKDGSSLGWPALVAMCSFLSGVAVEASFGFTGEVLLSGELSAVGFVEEKFLACEREGFSRLWLPRSNLGEIAQDAEMRGVCELTGVVPDVPALKALGLVGRRA